MYIDLCVCVCSRVNMYVNIRCFSTYVVSQTEGKEAL